MILDLSVCEATGNTITGSITGTSGMNIIKDNVYIKGIILPSGLTSVVIPEGVTSLGYALFYDCTALTTVLLESGIIIPDIGTGSPFPNNASLILAYVAGGAGTYILSGMTWTKQ